MSNPSTNLERILYAGAVFAIFLALALGLVASKSYEWIFVQVIVMVVPALGIFYFLARRDRSWRGWIAVPAVAGLYSLLDVALRFLAGARVFDAIA